jgi:hypothetical protein
VHEPTTPAEPREPEIEFLGKVARIGLAAIRVVFWVAGAGALVIGVVRIVIPEPLFLFDAGPLNEPSRIAQHVVWLCPGLLLVTPVEWTFGRGRWPMLAASALLWLVPIWLPGEADYGFVLRMFGTLIAFLTLAVWRTLWRLTDRGAPTGPTG